MILRDILSTLTNQSSQITLKDFSTGNEIAVMKTSGYGSLEDSIEQGVVRQWTINDANRITIALEIDGSETPSTTPKGAGFIDFDNIIDSGTFSATSPSSLTSALEDLDENAWLVLYRLKPTDTSEATGVAIAYRSYDIAGKSWPANGYSGMSAFESLYIPLFNQYTGVTPKLTNVEGSWALYGMKYDEE